MQGPSKGSSSSSAPVAPDPAATANAQAQANRLTQFTPSGDVIVGKTTASGGFEPAGAGQAAIQVRPTEAQQNVLGQVERGSQALATRGADLASSLGTAPVTFQGLPAPIQGIDFTKISGVPSPDAFSADAQAVEKATFDRGYNLLRPEFERQERRLEQELANRGLPTGSELADLTTDRYNRARTSALDDLSLASVTAGRGEQSRLFGQSIAAREAQIGDQLRQAQLNNAARATGFTERSAERTAQLNELAQLLGAQQLSVPNVGQFVQPGAVDIAGPQALAYQGQMAGWQNAQNAAQRTQSDLLGGLFGLGQVGTAAYFLQ